MEFDLNRTMPLLHGYKSIISGKIITFIYKLIIFIGFVLIVYHAFIGRAATRTAFFSSAIKGFVARAAAFAVTRLFLRI